MRRAVFLDRDGVLNRAPVVDGVPCCPASVAELDILDGVVEATRELREAGFLLVCVTNQPDVVRGRTTRASVESINEALRARLALAEMLVSYDDGDAPRRKPNPGMLLEAAARHAIDLGASFMVGDRWKDVEAGRRAGCRTILIDHHYDETWPVGPPDFRASSLGEAAGWILRQARKEGPR